MKKTPPQEGARECHGDVEIRHCELNIRLSCGGPGKPSPTCPPPEARPQPGSVNIPQPPPFTTPTTREPPGTGHPPPGSPDEIPWFRGEIDAVRRKGPTFGPRKDEFLPFLVVRATSGDRGQRPYSGVFWESPDIFVTPNVESSTAPLRPPTTAGIAQASVPNTVYAHVWNLGKAPAVPSPGGVLLVQPEPRVLAVVREPYRRRLDQSCRPLHTLSRVEGSGPGIYAILDSRVPRNRALP